VIDEDAPALVRRSIPSLAAAREQGWALPEDDPDETIRLAALRVVLHVQIRRTWREEVTLSAAQLARLLDVDPPPARSLEEQHVVLESVLAPMACPRCAARGVVPARVEGAGEVDCPECHRSGGLALTRVRRVVDSVEKLADVFLPRELRTMPKLLHVERIVETIVPEVPDDAFECADLRPVAQESAYRGAQRQQDPDFFGFDFRDTVDLAKRATDEFMSGKGQVLRYRIRAWGWPLLWLRWRGAPDLPRETEAVLVCDPGGAITVIRPNVA
jgi:hypothetical protein